MTGDGAVFLERAMIDHGVHVVEGGVLHPTFPDAEVVESADGARVELEPGVEQKAISAARVGHGQGQCHIGLGVEQRHTQHDRTFLTGRGCIAPVLPAAQYGYSGCRHVTTATCQDRGFGAKGWAGQPA